MVDTMLDGGGIISASNRRALLGRRLEQTVLVQARAPDQLQDPGRVSRGAVSTTRRAVAAAQPTTDSSPESKLARAAARRVSAVT